MPHVELKYSNNLTLNPGNLFNIIEEAINKLDSSAGVCKSRAFSVNIFKHTHLLVTINLLTKPHRNQDFSNTLIEILTTTIKQQITEGCYFSLELIYSSNTYFTTVFE